jgi:hypothetical protein
MQRGSIAPLIAGLLALTLTLSLGVSSLTSLTLERHRLVALAETIALRAAESFEPSRVRLSSGQVDAPLSAGLIRSVARETLAHTPHQHEDLRLLVATTDDGVSARIVLQSTWRPPFASEFLPASLPVRAEVRSRAIIH